MQFEQELKEKTAEVEALLERMLPEEEESMRQRKSGRSRQIP